MSRGGVLCAGTILVDAAKVIDAYPALDHLATIEQVSQSTGGPGLNMAVDLRMLGAAFPIGVLGAVGHDEHGAFILALRAAAHSFRTAHPGTAHPARSTGSVTSRSASSARCGAISALARASW